MKQEYLLSLAKKASNNSDHHTYKIGCVIAKGRRVIGIGYNLMKTHPKSSHSFKSIHAEFMAVMNSNVDVKGATAYVFRQQKNGTMAISRPCPSCWRYLKECGIKHVVYTFEGNFVQEKMK